MIVEAWGHRAPGAREYDRPHLIEWDAAKPTDHGRAFCGIDVRPVKLERHGMAREVKVPLCRGCTRALEDRHRPLPGGIFDLNVARRRRSTQ